ncbi:MAG: helix-turn-helix domain-containing protein [Chloroflexota bacterium]
MSRFSEWLSKQLQSRGISIGQLGAYTGISPSTLSYLVRGKTDPRYDTALRLAAFFRADPNYVLDLAGYEPVEPKPEAKLTEREAKVLYYAELLADLPETDQQVIRDVIEAAKRRRRRAESDETETE